MFANEHLGITFGGIAGTMGTLRASADFMWDISSWPWIEAGGQRVRASTYTPESLVIPATAANPDMAWEFIKHALSVDTYSEVTRRGHVFPVRRSVMASDAWINPELLPRNNQAFVDSLDVALPHIASIHATGSEMNTSTGAIANSYVSGAITLSETIENIDRVIRNLIGQ